MIRILPKKLPAPLSVWEMCNQAEKVLNSPSNLEAMQKEVTKRLLERINYPHVPAWKPTSPTGFATDSGEYEW